MKKMFRALISVIKKTSAVVLDQLKDPKIALFLFISTALLLFLPQSILTPLGLHAFVEGKRRLIGLIFFYSIKCFLAISVLWILVKIRKRIQSKRSEQTGKPSLHELTAEERKFLAGFVVQDTTIQHFNIRDDTLDGLLHSNILFLSPSANQVESSRYNMHPWAWAELRRHPELLEPELSDLIRSRQGTEQFSPQEK
jgi:uncharacterized membrane protein